MQGIHKRIAAGRRKGSIQKVKSSQGLVDLKPETPKKKASVSKRKIEEDNLYQEACEMVGKMESVTPLSLILSLNFTKKKSIDWLERMEVCSSF